MKVLQRQKDLLLLLSKYAWLHEMQAHEMLGGGDKTVTYQAVNELYKKGLIEVQWEKTDNALIYKGDKQ